MGWWPCAFRWWSVDGEHHHVCRVIVANHNTGAPHRCACGDTLSSEGMLERAMTAYEREIAALTTRCPRCERIIMRADKRCQFCGRRRTRA